MKVIIDGSRIEIETEEDGMTTERLIELAVKARSELPPERMGSPLGYTANLAPVVPLADGPYWSKAPRLGQGKPVDAS